MHHICATFYANIFSVLVWPLVYYLYIESCVKQIVNTTQSNGNSFGLGFLILF